MKGMRFAVELNKISFIEAIALMLIVTINRLSIGLPEPILSSCGSSAILNAIFISIIAIFLTFIIATLFKRFSNSDIIDVSEFLGGKFFKCLIGVILFVYIAFISALLLRNFVEVIGVIYYTDTPIIYLLAFFIVVCAIANLFGGKSVARTNVIFCGIMVISLLVTFFAVTPNITIQRALPILGYGATNTFFYGISNIFAFNGLLVLYLVPSLLKDSNNFKKACLIVVIISAILLILATACILLGFSFSTTIKQISPLYTLISNNELGRYLQHPESLFVFTWVLSFMTYINITCMLLVNILQKLTNAKNSKLFVVPVCILILLIAVLPSSIIQVRNIGDFVSKTFGTILTFVILPIILLIANIKHKKINVSKRYM